MLIRRTTNISQRAKRRNPLRLDPSRTMILRKSFEKTIKSQFAKFKMALLKELTKEDTLKLAKNASRQSVNPLSTYYGTLDWESRKAILEGKKPFVNNGGPGSGNFGHGGRPGEVGGSGDSISTKKEGESLSHEEVISITDTLVKKNKYHETVTVKNEEGPLFTVDGIQFKKAGECNLSTGHILLYSKEMSSKEQCEGLLSHEIMHGMYEKVWEKRKEEQAEISKLAKEMGREELKTFIDYAGRPKDAYKNKYPIVSALFDYENTNTDKLREEDGVSGYSKAYWQGFKNGSVSWHIAVHETLAEIARIHQETGKVPGTKIWKNFYKTVRKEYSKLPKKEAKTLNVQNIETKIVSIMYFTKDWKEASASTSYWVRVWYSNGRTKLGRIATNVLTGNGGPGSGNFGHEGRKGEVGGSSTEKGFSAVLYHGTSSDFDKFDLSKLHTGADSEGGKSFYGHGAYLTGEPWKAKMYAMSSPTGKVYSVKTSLNNPFVVKGTGAGDLSSALKEAGHDSKLSGQELTDRLKAAGHDGIVVLKNGENKVNEVSVFDPSGLSITHKEPAESFDHTKKKTITFNAWQFTTSDKKLQSFQRWMKTQLHETMLGTPQEKKWEAYVSQGYKKGQARSYDDVNIRRPKWDAERGDFNKSSAKTFLSDSGKIQEGIVKSKLIASRAFDELENVTTQMGNKMSRILVDGMLRGKDNEDIAKAMTKEIDISETRALLIARTEIVRAQAEGQLDMLEAMGVKHVGAEVEYTTSGNPQCAELSSKERNVTTCICPDCAELEGAIYTVEEARGMIPMHPQCMCSWTPIYADFEDEENEDALSD